MKKQLARFGVLTFAVAGLALGSFAVAGASSIGETGPYSENEIEWRNKVQMFLKNDNDIHLTNDNPQTAKTGEAEVEHNTTGGDATSGSAMNESMLDASVGIHNSNSGVADMFGDAGCGCDDLSIDGPTGPNSENEIEFKNESFVKVSNYNDVYITNNNSQYARSGEAEVEGNTTGGDATSGDATNSSSSTFSVDITN